MTPCHQKRVKVCSVSALRRLELCMIHVGRFPSNCEKKIDVFGGILSAIWKTAICLKIHCLETHRAQEFQKTTRDSPFCKTQMTRNPAGLPACSCPNGRNFAVLSSKTISPRFAKGRYSPILHQQCRGVGELRTGVIVTSLLRG